MSCIFAYLTVNIVASVVGLFVPMFWGMPMFGAVHFWLFLILFSLYVLVIVFIPVKIVFKDNFKKYLIIVYLISLIVSSIAIFGFKEDYFYQNRLMVGDVFISPLECNLALISMHEKSFGYSTRQSCYFHFATDNLQEEYCSKVKDFVYDYDTNWNFVCYRSIATEKNKPDICNGFSEPDKCYIEILPLILLYDDTYTLEYCDKIKDAEIKDNCFRYFAQEKKEIEYCKAIYQPNKEGHKYEICVGHAAIDQKDISICNEIVSDGHSSYIGNCVNDYIMNVPIELNDCYKLQNTDMVNWCVEQLVEIKEDFNLCSKFKGERAQFEKYSCLVNFAKKNGNIEICSKVDYYSPNINEETCRKEYYRHFNE